MRVWLYARLSNDDNREMNSLLNQQDICRTFAERYGHKIVGESFDDNVSGMKFIRRGLDEFSAAVDAVKLTQSSLKTCLGWDGIERRPRCSLIICGNAMWQFYLRQKI